MTDFKHRIASLPPGLSILQVAEKLGISYHRAFRAVKSSGYKANDGRTTGQNHYRKLNPDTVDWSLSNIEIAARCGVTRERVRFVRKALGKPAIEARGRKQKPQQKKA